MQVLEKKLEEFKLEKEAFWWYLDLRKYGSGKLHCGTPFTRLISSAFNQATTGHEYSSETRRKTAEWHSLI